MSFLPPKLMKETSPNEEALSTNTFRKSFIDMEMLKRE